VVCEGIVPAPRLEKFGSSEESVSEFRLRQLAESVTWGQFEYPAGAKTIDRMKRVDHAGSRGIGKCWAIREEPFPTRPSPASVRLGDFSSSWISLVWPRSQERPPVLSLEIRSARPGESLFAIDGIMQACLKCSERKRNILFSAVLVYRRLQHLLVCALLPKIRIRS